MPAKNIIITLTADSTSAIEAGALVGEDLVLVQSLTDPAHFNLQPVTAGGASIYIPTAKVQVGRRQDTGLVGVHVKGAQLGDFAGGVTNLAPQVFLSYEPTGDSSWTNYNPHYFLFYRVQNIRGRYGMFPGRQWPTNFTRGFVHPSQITDSGVGPSLFSNFSKGNYDIKYQNIIQYLIADFKTEWPVQTSFDSNGTIKSCATMIGNGTNDFNQFHPAKFFQLGTNSDGFTPRQDLFPISIEDWKKFVRTMGMSMRSRWSPSRVVSVKFAIAINVGGKIYMGQPSEILNLRPVMGYFGPSLEPYYYKWRVSFL